MLGVALLLSAISTVVALATAVFMIRTLYEAGIALLRQDARRQHLRRALWFGGLMALCPVLSALAGEAAAALAAAS